MESKATAVRDLKISCLIFGRIAWTFLSTFEESPTTAIQWHVSQWTGGLLRAARNNVHTQKRLSTRVPSSERLDALLNPVLYYASNRDLPAQALVLLMRGITTNKRSDCGRVRCTITVCHMACYGNRSGSGLDSSLASAYRRFALDEQVLQAGHVRLDQSHLSNLVQGRFDTGMPGCFHFRRRRIHVPRCIFQASWPKSSVVSVQIQLSGQLPALSLRRKVTDATAPSWMHSCTAASMFAAYVRWSISRPPRPGSPRADSSPRCGRLTLPGHQQRPRRRFDRQGSLLNSSRTVFWPCDSFICPIYMARSLHPLPMSALTNNRPHSNNHRACGLMSARSRCPVQPLLKLQQHIEAMPPPTFCSSLPMLRSVSRNAR